MGWGWVEAVQGRPQMSVLKLVLGSSREISPPVLCWHSSSLV